VVTSSKNQFLDTLNFKQLAMIFKDGGATTWNQVDPRFPNEKIAIFAPDTESGTYDFFNEKVLGDPEKGGLKPRSDYTASSDDNTLVQGIEGQANSWGYFGFAYYQHNSEGLKDIKVAEKGTQGIQPTTETITSGDHPLSRPLFIYVKEDSLRKMDRRKARTGERVIINALFVCAVLSVTVGIVAVLLVDTVQFFRHFSLVEFLTGTVWAPGQGSGEDGRYGVLPLLNGTLMIGVGSIAVGLMILPIIASISEEAMRRCRPPCRASPPATAPR
jgi:PBP superfamily domain